MTEANIAYKHVLLDLISDFEDFINKLEQRKEELEMLKDELLIYTDPEFMESIKRGVAEAEKGDIVRCKNSTDRKKLFESL